MEGPFLDDINLKKINCFPNTFEMERVHFLEDINMEKIKCSPNVKRKTSCTLASYSTSVTNTVSLNHRGFFALDFFYLPPPTHWEHYSFCSINANVMDQNLLGYFRG